MSDIFIRCDKCGNDFRYPQPLSVLYQATCPNCSEKNLRYIGNDPTIQRMLLTHYGVTKNMEEEIAAVRTHIDKLQSRLDGIIIDSKNIMTAALINAVQETIQKHVEEYHGYRASK